jgi:hypothetical protein
LDRYIGNKKQQGFLIIEGMIALATAVAFSFVIMVICSNLAMWHTRANQYLQATSLANHVFEQINLNQPVPNSVGIFTIKTSIKKDTKVPYNHIEVTIMWKNAHQEEKKIIFLGGNVDAA